MMETFVPTLLEQSNQDANSATVALRLLQTHLSVCEPMTLHREGRPPPERDQL